MRPARAIASLDRLLRLGAGFATIERPTDSTPISVTVRAKAVIDGANQPSPGVSKRKGTLIVSPTGLGPLGSPRRGDKLKLAAGTFTVEVPGPLLIGDTPVRYDIEFV